MYWYLDPILNMLKPKSTFIFIVHFTCTIHEIGHLLLIYQSLHTPKNCVCLCAVNFYERNWNYYLVQINTVDLSAFDLLLFIL